MIAGGILYDIKTSACDLLEQRLEPLPDSIKAGEKGMRSILGFTTCS